jgi:predicted Zn finger-like uncharacterized protein
MAFQDFTAEKPAENPHHCPACAAATIVTTAKAPSASSYWRCLSCGEVWTPARRQSLTVSRWRR